MLNFPAIGVWKPGQIVISWVENSRPIIPRVEQVIERAWNDAQKRPNIHLFDGPMCRIESLDAQSGKMHLTLSRTSYKPFWGTNLNHPELADEFGPQALANPVGLSALLISRDGFLMMGRRNEKVAYYPSRVHPFAGCLEPADKLDVFDDVRRELREELSLSEKDIVEIVCVGVAEDIKLKQPELIFAARSNRSRKEIEANLDPTEHGGVWISAATRPAIESALGSAESFTPVAVAALLLWGRTQFGDDWFEKRQ